MRAWAVFRRYPLTCNLTIPAVCKMRSPQNHHFDTLDALRGCAALVVALAHGLHIFVEPAAPDLKINTYIAGFAQASVMVFFVLSGFLIGTSIQNNIKNNSRAFSLAQYARSRALRIYPPLLLATLLTVLIIEASWAFVPKEFATRAFQTTYQQIFGSLFFLNGFFTPGVRINGPLWSLSIEVWYYAVAGLLFTARPFLMLIGVLLFWIGFQSNPFFYPYSQVWAAGFALCFVQGRNIHRIIKWAALLASISLAFHALDPLTTFATTKKNDDIIQYNVRIGLAFTFALFLMINSNRIKIHIGKQAATFSYTLYLIHFPVLMFTHSLMRSHLGNGLVTATTVMLCVLAACVLLSKFASTYVENQHWSSKIIAYKMPLPFTRRISSRNETP
ncbi:acyltransferase [Pseudothauera nasutitermitis]|uniref:Acyltransferase n=1 Tax=Pseudothauera nasutitermitis TaxID=2565930 RepID=A0A4S4AT95_9RHOO|nr:acyltransferase [Pseudothauera nasutitermitis]THF63125.1 acyltransferase [Pseudothauera nasutitermitis]